MISTGTTTAEYPGEATGLLRRTTIGIERYARSKPMTYLAAAAAVGAVGRVLRR